MKSTPRISDERVREKTGQGWQDWFQILDDRGATNREHKAIAAHLCEEHDMAGWWAQTVTVQYERAKPRPTYPHQPQSTGPDVLSAP